MADEKKTTFADVEQKFHSMPLTKYEIPEALEAEWLSTAVADFELNLGCDLGYNEETREFSGKLKSIAVRTLAQMMYVSYLQRELSRVMALNGLKFCFIVRKILRMDKGVAICQKNPKAGIE